MKSLPLVNIYNKKREIYLFTRNDKGDLSITKDNSAYPYFYEPDEQGKYTSFDGKKLRKVSVTEPSEVRRLASNQAYESDVNFTKQYIIQNEIQFEPTNVKYCFLDIENLSKDERPNPNNPTPVTSITLFNSRYNKIRNWFIGDFGTKRKQAELDLFKAFVEYMQKAKFDLWLSFYGIDYDYPFLFNRFKIFPQKYFFEKSSQFNNFAKAISPIHQVRGGNKLYDNFYPAGTSVVDYLSWIKKIYKNEKSYSLDKISEKYLKTGKKYAKVDFSIIDDTIKYRNIEDVELMVKLEQEKFKFIPLFDEIRRMCRVSFEDFNYNMRLHDMLFLTKAHDKHIILPSGKGDFSLAESKIEGAYREAEETGAFFELSKYDISGAYMFTIADLCLDSANIMLNDNENTLPIVVADRKTQLPVATYYVKQDPTAILPSVMRDLIEAKEKYKTLKNNTNPELPEYKDIERKYDAIKGIFLSGWGVVSCKFFRLFDPRVASMITGTVRDLLHYLQNRADKEGYKVVFLDTDSIFADTKGKDLSKEMNQWIQEWAQERFQKKSSIVIEYEGTFESIIILAKCRYKGWLRKSDGKIKEEERGIEAKRVDTTIYTAKFQRTLFDKIRAKESQSQITEWIKNEIEHFEENPAETIAFPAKLGDKIENYKTTFDRTYTDKITGEKCKKEFIKEVPIHVRAVRNIKQLFPDWVKRVGDNYSWIYVINNDVKKNVIAFDEDFKDPLKGATIDWEKQIERNILNKVKVIYDAMKWPMDELITPKVRKPRKVASNASKKAGECPIIDDLKQPKVSLPPKIKVKPANNTQLIDTTRVVTEYYISSPLITGNVRVDINEKIIWAIPAWNKFIGFDLSMFVKTVHADKVEQYIAKVEENKPSVKSKKANPKEDSKMLVPFKWAGNKKTLLTTIQEAYKTSGCTKIIEPFCGSAIFSLNTSAEMVEISDLNEQLICLWLDLKNHWDPFNSMLSTIDLSELQTDQEKYTLLRTKYNESERGLLKSVLLYALLGACTNNLARWNSTGGFNQTWGQRRSIVDKYLTPELKNRITNPNFNIFYRPYHVIAPDVNTFVYLDPPYLLSNDCYIANSWGSEEEIRLLEWIKTLKCKWALSNIIIKNDKTNTLLQSFAVKYNCLNLTKKYNAKVGGYANGVKNESQEVLITNFDFNLMQEAPIKFDEPIIKPTIVPYFQE